MKFITLHNRTSPFKPVLINPAFVASIEYLFAGAEHIGSTVTLSNGRVFQTDILPIDVERMMAQ